MDQIIETMRAWIVGEPVWPYAKIIESWGDEFLNWQTRMFREMEQAKSSGRIDFGLEKVDLEKRLDRGIAIWRVRDQWIREFGFAIPCAELLDTLAAFGPVVEVGAGTGYMTRLMRHRGIDVIGTDFDWQGPSSYRFEVGKLDGQQINGVPGKQMARRYRDRTIFCSWPSLKETWFRQMLKAMRVGQKLIVIREGACAEDTAWEYLDDCFEETATIHIPVFEHMNDYAQVCVKKRQRTR